MAQHIPDTFCKWLNIKDGMQHLKQRNYRNHLELWRLTFSFLKKDLKNQRIIPETIISSWLLDKNQSSEFGNLKIWAYIMCYTKIMSICFIVGEIHRRCNLDVISTVCLSNKASTSNLSYTNWNRTVHISPPPHLKIFPLGI